jgi:hypothetical protein
MTAAIEEVVIAGLDPTAGPKALRRGEGPAIHRAKRIFSMDARVKPAHDELQLWRER